MNREERIARARQMAAKQAPSSEEVTRKHASRLAMRLGNVGASQAQRHVVATEQSARAPYLDPTASPQEWERAADLVRQVAIIRAKRHDTITYGEVRWLVLDELRLVIPEENLADLMAAVDEKTDGVLLSSIMVDPETGEPGDAFLEYAWTKGFEMPTETMQRQVYTHFA